MTDPALNSALRHPAANEPLTAERAAATPPLRVGILISGRGSNMVALLDAMAAGRLSARAVLVASDNPDAPGLAAARDRGVPAACVDRALYPRRADHEAAVAAALQEAGAEWVCLAGYMRLLKGAILDAYSGRILNIHPALLPAFPGLHGQRQALEYGAKLSGCTVHLVDAGMDTGPVVLQAAVPVLDEDDEDTLSARILAEEHRLYPAAVQLAAEGRLAVQGRRVRILPPRR